MVTVILALVAWLILDALSQRPGIAPRFQHATGHTLPSSTLVAAWSSDEPPVLSEPGLSSSSARWNE